MCHSLTVDPFRRHQEKPWEENLAMNKDLWQEKVQEPFKKHRAISRTRRKHIEEEMFK